MAEFKRRWFMWDFARQRRFDREEFTLVAEKLNSLGYNGIGLYLEGAFELSCLGGGILREGVMTREDALWVKEKCASLGMTVFPMTNVVGHMEHFMRQQRFIHMVSQDDKRGRDICFTAPEAKEFVLKIIFEYVDAFKTDYIHIGGDEATLTNETRPLYAEFLADICDELLGRGIKPAIWDDLLWIHPELCEPFSREIEIFDWHYYGHRPLSIEFFRNQGFKNVVVCPCENSWVGFIGHQYICDWGRENDQTPVAADEVEAFLVDATEKGDPENLQGMLTHWEATMGRDIWGQWSAIARAGLFMSGKLDKENVDEQIEKAVFGRITPYTEIMHIIQNEIHILADHITHTSHFRTALFLKARYMDSALAALNDPEDLGAKAVVAIRKLEKLFASWSAENEFEKRCYADIASVIKMMKAAFALRTAFYNSKELYSSAAKIQFSDPAAAKELVLRFAEGFTVAAELIKAYRKDMEALVSCTAHTPTDLVKLDTTTGYTEKMAATIKDLAESPSFERIPLPAINYVLEWVLDDVVIEK